MKNKVNKTGYLDKSTTKYNNYNIISSSNLTMNGVSQKLMAVELDKDGKIIGTKFLEPNSGEYNFPNAQNIMETPQYKKGGDKKYTQEDLDMYLAMYMNGGMDEYQMGGNFQNPFVPPVDSSLQGLPSYNYQLNDKGEVVTIGANGNTQVLNQENNLNIPAITQPQQREQVQAVNNITPVENTIIPTNTEKELQDSISGTVSEDFNPEQRQGVELTNNPDIQFFNQYQGVDIPTAATTLGTSIEAGDTLGTVASSLKLATGLGRNIFGGVGQQRQYNRQQKEFYEKTGDNGAPISFQAGGPYLEEDLMNYMMIDPIKEKKKLTKQQVQEINSSTGEAQFTEEGANALFEAVPKVPTPSIPELDLGKYKGLEYFNITTNGDEYQLSPTRNNPANADLYKDNLNYLQKLNPKAKINRKGYIPTGERKEFQKGGQYQGNEYRTGLDEEMLSNEQKQLLNAETEAGEYIQDPNTQQVAEIIGNKHSQGGEKMIMEDGEKILTDHTKLGAKNAKYIRDTYDLNVKAKNTYADVLDKLRSKSGLKKLIAEEEGYIKQLEEQDKDGDETTQGINTKFLQDKLEEVKSKKEPIEVVRQAMFDDLYRIQEEDKPKEETEEFQGGGRYTGEGSAIENIPEGQSRGDEFYGQVDEQQFQETVKNNPWFDFTNFNPSNPEDVKRFQTEYNRLSTVGTQVKVDGKFGEQTQTIKLPQQILEANGIKPQGIVPMGDPKPKVEIPTEIRQPSIQEMIDSGASEEEVKRAMNVALLPNQYPMMPGSLEPTIKQSTSYERFDPSLIDPSLYLEQLQRSKMEAERKTEGLPPSVAAAQKANILANTQKAASDIMLKIDSQNINSKNIAEQYNTRVGNREVDANNRDDLLFEMRSMQAKSNTDFDIQNYFNKLQQVNKQNFMDIDSINRSNSTHDVQYDGSQYIKSDAPDFSRYYEMATNLAKYQKEKEELEKKSKK